MGVKIRQHHGQWFVFVNWHKQRKAYACGDKRNAEEFAIQARAELLRGKMPGVARTGETLAGYAERWLRDHATQVCKATTVRGYSDTLTLHLLPALGPKPLADITRGDCKALLKTCRDKGLKPKSLSNIARTLSTILTEAMEEGLIAANPAFRLGRYCASADALPFTINPFTREECSLFLNTAKDKMTRHYPLLLTALRTGMRLGEIIALQWGDIDWHGRFILVQRNRVRGKVSSPKNHKTRRVDLSAQLVEELKRLLVARKAEALKSGGAVPVWVFCTRDGEPFDGDNVRHQAFDTTLAKSGLRHIRFHDLRHTYASLLLQDGAPITYVRDQLGHSSIKVTVDIYGHLIPGANRAAVDRLDDLRPGTTPAQPSTETAKSESA